MNQNDLVDDNDDSVELVVRTPTISEDRTIEEFRSEFIDNYEVNVIEVRPSGAVNQGSARIEVSYNPLATGGGFQTGGGAPQGGGFPGQQPGIPGQPVLGPDGQPLQQGDHAAAASGRSEH